MLLVNSEFQKINPTEDSTLAAQLHTDDDVQDKFIVLARIDATETAADEIIEVVSETFRHSLRQARATMAEPFSIFESAIKSTNTAFANLQKEGRASLKDTTITIATIIGTELYIAQQPKAESYLLRGQYVSVISEAGAAAQKEELFENISCGQLEEGDIVIFASERLLRYAIKSELPIYFNGVLLDKGTQNLANQIQTEALHTLGIATLKVAKSVEPEIEVKATNQKWWQKLNFIPGSSKKKTAKLKKRSGSKIPVKLDKYIETAKNWLGSFGLDRFLTAEYRTQLILFAVGSVLVAGLVITQIVRWQSIAQYEDVFVEVRTKITDAQKAGNRETAGALLDQAEADLRPLLSESIIRTEAYNVLEEINLARGQFDDVTLIAEPRLIGNLDKLSENTTITQLAKLYDDVFAVNATEIATILVDSIKTPIELTTTDNSTIEHLVTMPDTGSVYAILTDRSVIEYKNGEAQKIEVGDEGTVQPTTAAEVFGSRIYVLDNTNEQIWRYSRSVDGLSAPESYLQTAALPAAKDLAIDGSIYVLTDNNQIVRYFGGQIDNFVITNEPLALPQNPSKIYTTEAESLLYLLDPSQNKIFVYYKNPQTENLDYLRQYQFQQIDQIIDFAIDDQTRRIYVTDGRSVYSGSMVEQ